MKILLKWIIILATIYFLFLTYLYVKQDSLTFFPNKTTDADWTALIEEIKGDYVSIRADDGEVLEGIFLSDHTEEPRPTIIFFEGNAMRVETLAKSFVRLRDQGINVLLMDYRGYGLSTGKPSTEAMKKDAEKIFDAVNQHPHVDHDNIIAWGYSIGTGIATHVSSVKPVSKVILFAPFTTTTEIAKKWMPFTPVSLLFKHKLSNIDLAPLLLQPGLIVVGENDLRIPPAHSRLVSEAWGGDVELVTIAGRKHNDLLEDEKAWSSVLEFVSR